MNKITGNTIQTEIDHIRQSIVDILLTPKGTRIYRRDYGSDLFVFLDAPISSVLLLQLSSAVVFAIERWESRVKVARAEIALHSQKLVLNLHILHKSKNHQLAPITLKDF